MLRMMVSATVLAPSASGRWVKRTANSSPPSRATVSVSRTHRPSLLATRPQQQVADGMAERIIHLLELVEIEQQQRIIEELRRPGQSVMQAVLEKDAVGQGGQTVVMGQMVNVGGRHLAFGDVAADHHQSLAAAILVEQGHFYDVENALAAVMQRDRLLKGYRASFAPGLIVGVAIEHPKIGRRMAKADRGSPTVRLT